MATFIANLRAHKDNNHFVKHEIHNLLCEFEALEDENGFISVVQSLWEEVPLLDIFLLTLIELLVTPVVVETPNELIDSRNKSNKDSPSEVTQQRYLLVFKVTMKHSSKLCSNWNESHRSLLTECFTRLLSTLKEEIDHDALVKIVKAAEVMLENFSFTQDNDCSNIFFTQWQYDTIEQLINLHRYLINQNRTDGLKHMTFIWKNLTKLAKHHQNKLLTDETLKNKFVESMILLCEHIRHHNSSLVSFPWFKEAPPHISPTGSEPTTFNNEEAICANMQLHLRLIRLSLRAFSTCFKSTCDILSKTQVESCLLILQEVLSQLTKLLIASMYWKDALQVLLSEFSRLIAMVLNCLEVAISDKKIMDSTKNYALCFIRQLDQIKPSGSKADQTEEFYHWRLSQLLLYSTCITSLSAPISLEIAEEILNHYQACITNIPFEQNETNILELFVDIFLRLLLRLDMEKKEQENVVPLFLLKVSLQYPKSRLVCYKVWYDLFSSCWYEEESIAVIQMLFDALFEIDASTKLLQVEICNIIAYCYPSMPNTCKYLCVEQATNIIEVLISEGPQHILTQKLASKLELFSNLVSVSFLRHSGQSNKEKEIWNVKYLPIAFESTEIILSKLRISSINEIDGMLRVLCVSLLIIQTVYEDKDRIFPEAEHLELAGVICQLSIVSISTIANIVSSKIMDTINSRLSYWLLCILNMTLKLLEYFGPQLKENRQHQCVQLMKDLCIILDHNTDFWAPIIVSWFISSTLIDVQVVEEDIELMQLLFSRMFGSLLNSVKIQNTAEFISSTKHSPEILLVFEALYRWMVYSNTIETPQFLNLFLHNILNNQASLFQNYVRLRKTSKNQAIQLYWQLNKKNGVQFCPIVFRGHEPSQPKILPLSSNGKRILEVENFSFEKRRKLVELVGLCEKVHISYGAWVKSTNDTNIAQLPDSLLQIQSEELDSTSILLNQLLSKVLPEKPN